MLVIAAVVWSVLASAASATPVGPDCPTCFGNVYTLEVFIDPLRTLSNGNQIVVVTYTLDASHSKGQGALLDAIAFSVAANVAASSNNKIVLPQGGNWSLHVNAGLGASGCAAAATASAGIVCIETTSSRGPRAAGSVLTWQLELEVNGLFFDPQQGEVKALFVNGGHKPKAFTDEPISIDFLIVD
jgi:hypothetical protein